MRRTPSDYELCLRFRAGDEWSFEELLRRHVDIVHFHANQYDTRGDAREDIEQIARLGLLKAARLFTLGRGSGFRNYASLSIQRAIFSHIRLANGLKHRALDTSMRFEYPVRVRHDETMDFGELVLGRESDDPAEIFIARETFERQVETIVGCAPTERAAVAWRLNGGHWTGERAASMSSHGKSMDNALQRVRRKLKAAA